MTGTASPSPFDIATATLRALGITLARLPGEYRVNYRNGADATARIAETVDEALALGRELAAAAPEPATLTTRGKRRRRPLRMTPKAVRRRMIRKHNQRMRSRAIRQEKQE